MRKEAEKASKEGAEKYRKDLHNSGSDCDEENYMCESVPSDASIAGLEWVFKWIGEQGMKSKNGKPKCVACGRDIDIVEEDIYGNFCRKNESYCKECYEKLDKKTKKLLDWHFSCDWL